MALDDKLALVDEGLACELDTKLWSTSPIMMINGLPVGEAQYSASKTSQNRVVYYNLLDGSVYCEPIIDNNVFGEIKQIRDNYYSIGDDFIIDLAKKDTLLLNDNDDLSHLAVIDYKGLPVSLALNGENNVPCVANYESGEIITDFPELNHRAVKNNWLYIFTDSLGRTIMPIRPDQNFERETTFFDLTNKEQVGSVHFLIKGEIIAGHIAPLEYKECSPSALDNGLRFYQKYILFDIFSGKQISRIPEPTKHRYELNSCSALLTNLLYANGVPFVQTSERFSNNSPNLVNRKWFFNLETGGVVGPFANESIAEHLNQVSGVNILYQDGFYNFNTRERIENKTRGNPTGRLVDLGAGRCLIECANDRKNSYHFGRLVKTE